MSGIIVVEDAAAGPEADRVGDDQLSVGVGEVLLVEPTAVVGAFLEHAAGAGSIS